MEMLLRAILVMLGRIEENQRARREGLREAFFAGVLRGVGGMVGFAVVGTALLYVLRYIAGHNLPLISDFLAEVIGMVQARLQ